MDFRIAWRGDSALADGADRGVDLTGGFYDAGDHNKFALPMLSTMTLLSWGAVEYPQGYSLSGQQHHLLGILRWGYDWILKAHLAPQVFVAQVGFPPADHAFWGPAEVMTMARPSYVITATQPGSEIAGEAAAALAAGAMVFQSQDAAYAARLLAHARQLYRFADEFRGSYVNAVPEARNYYNSFSGYFDELLWASLWMYRATGEVFYLQKAESFYAAHFAGASLRWTHNWDDKTYGSLVLLAQLTGQEKYRQAAEGWLNFWAGTGSSRITTTPGGLAWLGQWGSLRYAATTSFLAFVYADTVRDPSGHYHTFARRQMRYILGDNPAQRSYVVGFGQNPPRNPHHRTAHGSWSNSISSPSENRHILYGALVGGPTAANDFAYTDSRTDYVANEVALDYNAGFTGALARLVQTDGGQPLANFPPAVVPDNEFFVEAAINQQGAGFTEVRALINNRSAFPASGSDFLSFRYYVDLSELVAAGYAPASLRATTPFSQGATISGPHPHDASRHLYYFLLDFTGTTIMPGSAATFRREVQFRLALPSGAPASAWNPTNDFSYQGLPVGGNQAQPAPRLPVYQLDEKLSGQEPD